METYANKTTGREVQAIHIVNNSLEASRQSDYLTEKILSNILIDDLGENIWIVVDDYIRLIKVEDFKQNYYQKESKFNCLICSEKLTEFDYCHFICNNEACRAEYVCGDEGHIQLSELWAIEKLKNNKKEQIDLPSSTNQFFGDISCPDEFNEFHEDIVFPVPSEKASVVFTDENIKITSQKKIESWE